MLNTASSREDAAVPWMEGGDDANSNTLCSHKGAKQRSCAVTFWRAKRVSSAILTAKREKRGLPGLACKLIHAKKKREEESECCRNKLGGI